MARGPAATPAHEKYFVAQLLYNAIDLPGGGAETVALIV
jgi:hypothetical protein